jgi:hypothetical protein
LTELLRLKLCKCTTLDAFDDSEDLTPGNMLSRKREIYRDDEVAGCVQVGSLSSVLSLIRNVEELVGDVSTGIHEEFDNMTQLTVRRDLR